MDNILTFLKTLANRANSGILGEFDGSAYSLNIDTKVFHEYRNFVFEEGDFVIGKTWEDCDTIPSLATGDWIRVKSCCIIDRLRPTLRIRLVDENGETVWESESLEPGISHQFYLGPNVRGFQIKTDYIPDPDAFPNDYACNMRVEVSKD